MTWLRAGITTLLFCSGCSGEDAVANDAGSDAGSDSGSGARDAGPLDRDGGPPAMDAGPPAMDAGTDAGAVDADLPIDADLGSVAASLDGLRWELPCIAIVDETACTTMLDTQSTTLAGEPGVLYDITVRVRGVVEQETYSGGVRVGGHLVGGTPARDGYNIYELTVSDPPLTIYLNPGSSGLFRCFPVDDVITIPARAGATFTLTGDPMNDLEIRNIDDARVPIVIAGVPPAPAAFDGQFIQMDVESVVRATP